jgi:hypothetical protein
METRYNDNPAYDISLDYSAKDGANAYGGRHGVNGVNNHTIHGGSAPHGENGADGENIDITLSADEAHHTVRVMLDNGSEYRLPLGYDVRRINIKATDGKGGNCGNGGNGGNAIISVNPEDTDLLMLIRSF